MQERLASSANAHGSTEEAQLLAASFNTNGSLLAVLASNACHVFALQAIAGGDASAAGASTVRIELVHTIRYNSACFAEQPQPRDCIWLRPSTLQGADCGGGHVGNNNKPQALRLLVWSACGAAVCLQMAAVNDEHGASAASGSALARVDAHAVDLAGALQKGRRTSTPPNGPPDVTDSAVDGHATAVQHLVGCVDLGNGQVASVFAVPRPLEHSENAQMQGTSHAGALADKQALTDVTNTVYGNSCARTYHTAAPFSAFKRSAATRTECDEQRFDAVSVVSSVGSHSRATSQASLHACWAACTRMRGQPRGSAQFDAATHSGRSTAAAAAALPGRAHTTAAALLPALAGAQACAAFGDSSGRITVGPLAAATVVPQAADDFASSAAAPADCAAMCTARRQASATAEHSTTLDSLPPSPPRPSTATPPPEHQHWLHGLAQQVLHLHGHDCDVSCLKLAHVQRTVLAKAPACAHDTTLAPATSAELAAHAVNATDEAHQHGPHAQAAEQHQLQGANNGVRTTEHAAQLLQRAQLGTRAAVSSRGMPPKLDHAHPQPHPRLNVFKSMLERVHLPSPRPAAPKMQAADSDSAASTPAARDAASNLLVSAATAPHQPAQVDAMCGHNHGATTGSPAQLVTQQVLVLEEAVLLSGCGGGRVCAWRLAQRPAPDGAAHVADVHTPVHDGTESACTATHDASARSRSPTFGPAAAFTGGFEHSPGAAEWGEQVSQWRLRPLFQVNALAERVVDFVLPAQRAPSPWQRCALLCTLAACQRALLCSPLCFLQQSGAVVEADRNQWCLFWDVCHPAHNFQLRAG